MATVVDLSRFRPPQQFSNRGGVASSVGSHGASPSAKQKSEQTTQSPRGDQKGGFSKPPLPLTSSRTNKQPPPKASVQDQMDDGVADEVTPVKKSVVTKSVTNNQKPPVAQSQRPPIVNKATTSNAKQNPLPDRQAPPGSTGKKRVERDSNGRQDEDYGTAPPENKKAKTSMVNARDAKKQGVVSWDEKEETDSRFSKRNVVDDDDEDAEWKRKVFGEDDDEEQREVMNKIMYEGRQGPKVRPVSPGRGIGGGSMSPKKPLSPRRPLSASSNRGVGATPTSPRSPTVKSGIGYAPMSPTSSPRSPKSPRSPTWNKNATNATSRLMEGTPSQAQSTPRGKKAPCYTLNIVHYEEFAHECLVMCVSKDHSTYYIIERLCKVFPQDFRIHFKKDGIHGDIMEAGRSIVLSFRIDPGSFTAYKVKRDDYIFGIERTKFGRFVKGGKPDRAVAFYVRDPDSETGRKEGATGVDIKMHYFFGGSVVERSLRSISIDGDSVSVKGGAYDVKCHVNVFNLCVQLAHSTNNTVTDYRFKICEAGLLIDFHPDSEEDECVVTIPSGDENLISNFDLTNRKEASVTVKIHPIAPLLNLLKNITDEVEVYITHDKRIVIESYFDGTSASGLKGKFTVAIASSSQKK